VNKLRLVVEGLSKLAGYFSGWLVPLMIALILVEVFMRYVLRQPPLIADEFSAYMLVAMSYLGAAYTFRERGHVRITALVSRLPSKISNWLRVITLVMGLGFSVALTKSSYDFMEVSYRFKMASATQLNFPLQGPQMTVGIGFAILSLLLAVETIKMIINLKSGRAVEEKEE
jgi:TRAP-type C4-dicarboxylate transport system permease small subunit